MNRIIVALTSYPARINGILKVLDSMMNQTCRPDKVILYLAEEQFEKRNLLVDLTAYFNRGLEIHWCQNDMKSHKKYFYAFREYPDDYIITIDDDYYYEKHMVEELVQYTNKFSKCVLARRTRLITVGEDGVISPYEKWWNQCMHYVGIPRMDLHAVGCGGILYPPHLLSNEVFNAGCIKEYCMYADDIWLKVMELISNVSVVQVPTRFMDRFNEDFIQDGLYEHHNGNGGNDRSLRRLLEKYNCFGGMRETLVDSIFSTGTVCESEITEGRKKDNIRLLEECLASIGMDKDIVIYGAGIVAGRVFLALDRYGMSKNIKAFVVGDINGNAPDINHVQVMHYKDMKYENAVCIIAVTDSVQQDQISKQLMAIGVQESRIYFLNIWVLSALREMQE